VFTILITALLCAPPAYADWGPAEELPINTPDYEWGVCANADGTTIYFVSDRGGNMDIYKSRRAGSGWAVPERLPEPINSPGLEGAPCLSWNGQRLYFSRYLNGFAETIYVTVREGGRWGAPYKIPGEVNQDTYDVSNPAISAVASTLYFVGNEWPTNQTHFNIYSSQWTPSGWGKPVYLSGINTVYGESDPALSYDGRYLYFMSVRTHDFYIYRAERVGNSWGNPVPLGPNVNRPGYAQMDPSVTANGQYLFFSRAEVNDYDIYVSRWQEPAVEPVSIGRVKALFR
jgi:hypothetical protein